jgi:uncharacterized membrane protein
MAATATSRRKPASRRARPGSALHGRSKTRQSAELVKTAERAATGKGLVGTAARKGLKVVGRRAVRTGVEALRAAADRSSALSRSALESGVGKRAPIQVSVDVAVPVKVAWAEWMTFSALTEGVHRIDDVERDGDVLLGRTAGSRSLAWEAEILDERDQESFAWRSVEGSDCAGLVTFHRLSDRLTRIELDLDVLPTRASEAVSLALHLADRRAETELRRFKAAVEFISPDEYEREPGPNGKGPKRQRKRPSDA